MPEEVNIKIIVSGITQSLAGLKSLEHGFNALRSSIPVLIAGKVINDLREAIGAAIDMADAAGKMAQKTGIAVDQLTALAYSAHLSDLSNEQLTLGIKKFSEELVKSGKSTADVETELLNLADQFSKAEDGALKTTRAVQLFGKSGQEFIPWLNRGAEAIRAEMNEAKLFGVVIGPQFSSNANEFNDNMKRIELAVHGAWLQVAEKLLPSLIVLSNRLIQFVKDIQDAIHSAAQFGEVQAQAAENATESWQGFFASILGGPLYASIRAAGQVAARTLTEPMTKGLSDVVTGLARAAFPKGKSDIIDPEDVKRAADVSDRLEIAYLNLGGIASENDRMFGEFASEGLRNRKQIEEINKLVIAEKDKDQLLLQNEELFQANKAEIQAKWFRKSQDTILAEEKLKFQARQAELRGYSEFLGSLAELARVFGRKGFAAYKALAIASAIIDTIRGAQAAYTSTAEIPYIGPAAAPIAAATAYIAGAARVAQIAQQQPQGYQAGGFTGMGPIDQPAGQVHRREFVFDAPATSRIGVSALEALRAGDISTGEAAAAAVTVQGHQVTNLIVPDENFARQLLKSRAGTEEVINIVRMSKLQIGIA